jgi:hypothetical protein
MPTGSRIRLIGLDWTFANVNQLSEFYDLLESMTGLSETDGNLPTAQVAGHLHVPRITGTELNNFSARYPNISITYDEIYYLVQYQNYDTAPLYSYEARGGTTAIDPVAKGYISAPKKPSTPSANYPFDGWGTLPVVNSNITLTAQYKTETIYYSVKFYNVDNTLLYTAKVPYLGDAVYQGAEPVQPNSSSTYTKFVGWYPQPFNITGSTSCHALFCDPVQNGTEISDSWERIIASTQDGTYATKYQIGQYKPITLSNGNTLNMIIVDMYKDKLASENGNAAITFYSDAPFNGDDDTDMGPMKFHNTRQGYITWENCDIRQYFNSELKEMIPSTVRNAIKQVGKKVHISNDTGIFAKYNATSIVPDYGTYLKTVNDYVWLVEPLEYEYITADWLFWHSLGTASSYPGICRMTTPILSSGSYTTYFCGAQGYDSSGIRDYWQVGTGFNIDGKWRFTFGFCI